MSDKDCPQCGMNLIRENVELCEACELDEKWSLRYQLLQAELFVCEKRHARYLDEIGKAIGNDRLKRHTGEPARSDKAEIIALHHRIAELTCQHKILYSALEDLAEGDCYDDEVLSCKAREALSMVQGQGHKAFTKEQTVCNLSPEDQQCFAEALINPPNPGDALKSAKKSHTENVEQRFTDASPSPRYDDVFFEGQKWLDDLASGDESPEVTDDDE